MTLKGSREEYMGRFVSRKGNRRKHFIIALLPQKFTVQKKQKNKTMKEKILQQT